MLSNLIIPAALVRKTISGRYHPILFRLQPDPTGKVVVGKWRYRSFQHHVRGFETVEEARAHIATQPRWHDTGAIIDWVHPAPPMLIEWFSLEQLNVTA